MQPIVSNFSQYQCRIRTKSIAYRSKNYYNYDTMTIMEINLQLFHSKHDISINEQVTPRQCAK